MTFTPARPFSQSRNIIISILCSFLSLSLFAPAAYANSGDSAAPIKVYVDEAKLIELSQPVSQIIIGNPAIADVHVQSRQMLVFTGKSAGHTNIILLDKDHNQILNRKIEVTTSPGGGLVMVYRGTSRSSYHCGTVCNGEVALGDNPKFTQDVLTNTRGKLDFIARQAK